mmetsp:Transcript_17818/g.24740  ORF Transcript_17818/g.24740 Transcript_17818/m.24740 type:complete len:328 (-) Transcript_17818:38-1021(-)|eukprot:CAMPEP_0201490226 /NCGR_PEP_ID=MMETSP0151_2-20130828/25627_1 /ASSEMBLY_ACC=CAM_ASM_000257 /TAXON_ID=200890 /ORGANISM="Paramoeba atlantica, Strain 621/1 / CCAP 1560/9" /LENGTH=327 /DNA_ID=CAMNT_0047876095 /DNA_START=97 /DNA_END=1080 /DNA_ORIENTATION=-
MSSPAKVYVIHENGDWLKNLRETFKELDVPYEEWDVGKGGVVDLSEEPPQGVFYNRVSPSSHIRDNRWAVEHTEQILYWLELHERRVVNGLDALKMEVSKVKQFQLLKKAGIPTPKTIAITGDSKESWFGSQITQLAKKTFGDEPFIVKVNRGGSGAGVQLFKTIDELENYFSSDTYEQPLDGVQLLQEFIPCEEKFITRLEFVDGKFMYAVRVDTSNGFQLCPADACSAKEGELCPIRGKGGRRKFVIEEFSDQDLIERLEKVLEKVNVEVAGIEVIRGDDGVTYCYDMNANTNYNSSAEIRAFGKKQGSIQMAEFLNRLLSQENK